VVIAVDSQVIPIFGAEVILLAMMISVEELEFVAFVAVVAAEVEAVVDAAAAVVALEFVPLERTASIA